MPEPYLVRGFHGTTTSRARLIRAQSRIMISNNDYDWLGTGAYFFQDAPLRAWKWATNWATVASGEAPAVIAADIDLDGCFDLLDIDNWRFIETAYNRFNFVYRSVGLPVPAQAAPIVRSAGGQRYHVASPQPVVGQSGRNLVDCAVVRLALQLFTKSTGKTVRSVRGAFIEGREMHDNSYFFDHMHVQIAVLKTRGVLSNFTIEDSNLLGQAYAASRMTRWPI